MVYILTKMFIVMVSCLLCLLVKKGDKEGEEVFMP